MSPRTTLRDAAVLALCLAAAAGLSLALGQDANWDLQNYHYYNPWAWVHGQRGYSIDIVAAQLQTYHNPLPDVPFYQMVKERWDPRVIASVMAVPAGIAAFFLWKLLVVLFRDLPRMQRWAAVGSALAIGTTSAIGLGVLGTTMNEWPGAMLTVAALYVIVRALATGPAISRRALVIAGLSSGFATGGKFTFGVFAVAMCAAILLRGPWRLASLRKAVVEAFTFGLAVLAGTLVTAGWWMWSLWTQFRNPVFPYGNIWIKSPWWGEYEVMGRQFGPHTLLEWLVFPFSLASPPPFYVTEVSYVDGRIPVLYALAVAVAGAALIRRWSKTSDDEIGKADAPFTVLAIFFLVSFLLWTAQYSIFRYLVPLELVSGALIVAILVAILRAPARIPVTIMAAIALIGTTSVPDWWRIDFGRQWFEIAMPPIDRDPLVLLTSDAPMSYVLPSFPKDARFLGIDNSISDARRKTLMEEAIARRIREHKGPLYSLSYPAGTGVDALLERHILKITETCIPIVTNMRTSPIELCRVVQAPPP
jgi:hypothetical protein